MRVELHDWGLTPIVHYGDTVTSVGAVHDRGQTPIVQVAQAGPIAG